MEVRRSRQLKAGIFAQFHAEARHPPSTGRSHTPPDSLHPFLCQYVQEAGAGTSSRPGPSDDAGPSSSGDPFEEADAEAVRQLVEQARKGVGHIMERVATPHIAALQTWEGGLVDKLMAAAAELDQRGEEKTASAVAKDKALLLRAMEQLSDGPAKAALQAIQQYADTMVPPRAFALASFSDPGKLLALYKCAGLDNSGYAHVQDAFCRGVRSLGFGSLAYQYSIRDVNLAPQPAGAPRAGGREPAGGQRGAAGVQPWVWKSRAPAAAKPAATKLDRFKTARACCGAIMLEALPTLKDAGLRNALCHYDKPALCCVEEGQTYCKATRALIAAGTLAEREDLDAENMPLGTFSLQDASGRQAGAEGGVGSCARLRLWLAQQQQQPEAPAQGGADQQEELWEYPRHAPLVMFSSAKSGIAAGTYEAIHEALVKAPALAGVRAAMEAGVANVRAALGVGDARYGTRCSRA